MRYAPAILAGRLVRLAARARKRGGGSAVPGLVVNRIAPGFLARVLNSFPDGLVIVSGSSGKSTTTKMLVGILRDHGKRVFTNPSTANISQGLTSALLERVALNGRIDADLAVLEMDEGHGALIAPTLEPRVVVLTNVMTDQIDRFHQPEQVAGMLAKIAARASGAVVINADDGMLLPLSTSLVPGCTAFLYGVSASVLAASPRGLGYAVEAPTRTDTGTVVESVDGRDCSIVSEGERALLRLPARGVHFAVDAAAAISGARAVLGGSFDLGTAAHSIGAMPPVFARGEVTEVRGAPVEFVLVQNPASFQLNIDELPPGLDQVFVAVGSDVRDPSYFWPVDASRLGRVTTVSGSKAHEIALQLLYQGVHVDSINPDLARALDDFFALPAPDHGVKTVIFSADSMRRTRAHLGLV